MWWERKVKSNETWSERKLVKRNTTKENEKGKKKHEITRVKWSVEKRNLREKKTLSERNWGGGKETCETKQLGKKKSSPNCEILNEKKMLEKIINTWTWTWEKKNVKTINLVNGKKKKYTFALKVLKQKTWVNNEEMRASKNY